jgi:2-isopropylmalate synthase
MDNKHVYIFDTTLRDGLQSPGVLPLTLEQRVEIGMALADMRVDVIEAGFAIGSKLDFDSIHALAQKGIDSTVCSLSRVSESDIEKSAEAIKGARRGRIHTFISTSPLHMEHKLRMSPEQVLEAAVKGVKLARNYTDDVEFSLEDFTRTDKEFSYKVIEAVIKAGATTVNLPDTVGYSMPEEYGQLIANVRNNVANVEDIILSTHCHNDLGVAVATSLAGVANGARQVECSINGIGERAGNAAMEEVVMAMNIRNDIFQTKTDIITEYFTPISNLVSKLTGMPVQRNKAIVGENAFTHESGIHQHGVNKNRETYEIMTPESVGQGSELTLGVTSGRSGLAEKMKGLGFNLNKESIDKLYPLFIKQAENGRVSDSDLQIMAENIL